MTAFNAFTAMNAPAEMPQDIQWMNSAVKALAVVLLLLVLAAGLGVLMRQPAFTIRKLTLEGDLQRNNLATVRANAVPRVNGGFFTVDLRKSKDVFETVPWVRHAVVRRVWPNELRVSLEEHQPAAYWHHEDRDDQLVNMQGEVFDANLGDVEDEPLPTLHAPAHATPDQAREMLAMLHRLKPVLKGMDGEIDILKLTDRGSWSVQLDNDALIELGRGDTEEVVARAERFVKTLPQLRNQYPSALAYADLRYPKGYAVRLKGMTTMQENSGVHPVGKPRQ
jgi:cell division protein FtsQ